MIREEWERQKREYRDSFGETTIPEKWVRLIVGILWSVYIICCVVIWIFALYVLWGSYK